MRLFIAIDLDEAARQAIAGEQTRLRATLGETRSQLSWVRPDHLHLTLVFLGEVAESDAHAATDAIGVAIAQRSFDLAFSGIGVFPPRGAPSVLWLGVTVGARESIDLQRQLADRARRLNIPLETRPFHPHLTLARWRTSRTSRPSDRTRMLDAGSDRVIARVRVEHATLYQSRLSPAGPTYTALARATLTGSER